jgi:hypothetical protein
VAPGSGATNGSTKQTGAATAQQPCWVQPRLAGSPGQYKIPQLKAARFSSK